jgi:hypothetical protein
MPSTTLGGSSNAQARDPRRRCAHRRLLLLQAVRLDDAAELKARRLTSHRRARGTGRSMMKRGPKSRSLAERLWTRVEKRGECLVWTGYCKPDGHGQIRRGARGTKLAFVHVAAWELVCGPVPPGHELHHTCFTPACIRIGHLKPLTRAKHMAAHAAARTTCPHGHPLDGRRHAYGKPLRYCKTCKRGWDQARYLRKRAAA